MPTCAGSAGAHVLLCHGNAGNVGDRVMHAALLCAAGLDILLFDYRGYGRSSGRPSEPGTYPTRTPRGPRYHELFHVLVVGAAAAHFVAVAAFAVPLASSG